MKLKILNKHLFCEKGQTVQKQNLMKIILTKQHAPWTMCNLKIFILNHDLFQKT